MLSRLQSIFDQKLALTETMIDIAEEVSLHKSDLEEMGSRRDALDAERKKILQSQDGLVSLVVKSTLSEIASTVAKKIDVSGSFHFRTIK